MQPSTGFAFRTPKRVGGIEISIQLLSVYFSVLYGVTLYNVQQ